MQQTADVLFSEIAGQAGDLGIIMLNRPQVLNALNHDMMVAMHQQLTAWESANNIKAVVIQAQGRAFCAGGDIRLAYEKGRTQDPQVHAFFADEYTNNRLIYHYAKPYIALMDGLTMGGGAGISILGSHRVATENFSFAMPETGIGFYPDVGIGYYLARMPAKIGFYLGLTGARITPHDCLALNLIDAIVPVDAFPKILEKLAASPLNNDATISEAINFFAKPVEKSELLTHEAEIQTCFSKNTYEEIFSALENYPTPWCEQVGAIINTKSPTSLKVTLKQLQTYARLSFDACMELDERLTRRFLQGHDFYEGVRAAIIDKDQTPHWSPAKIKEVFAVEVEKYFLE
jgi:enoyl-CoA hydratase